MNYTEEKAGKKLCPMAFGKGLPKPVRCFGSECMWWEWVKTKEQGRYMTHTVTSKTHGRCGANK